MHPPLENKNKNAPRLWFFYSEGATQGVGFFFKNGLPPRGGPPPPFLKNRKMEFFPPFWIPPGLLFFFFFFFSGGLGIKPPPPQNFNFSRFLGGPGGETKGGGPKPGGFEWGRPQFCPPLKNWGANRPKKKRKFFFQEKKKTKNKKTGWMMGFIWIERGKKRGAPPIFFFFPKTPLGGKKNWLLGFEKPFPFFPKMWKIKRNNFGETPGKFFGLKKTFGLGGTGETIFFFPKGGGPETFFPGGKPNKTAWGLGFQKKTGGPN